MSEPCEHQRDEAAWIWAQQLRFVADERDAAKEALAVMEVERNMLRNLLTDVLAKAESTP